MKKSLIALAAIAASGLAMAQSSVTLYGVADIAVGRTGNASYDPHIPGSKRNTTGVHSNSILNNGNSRIGFRGTEDLGNGLKANFQFEQSVNLADGSTDQNTFARQAWVGLSGDFGEVRAGRQYTPTYDATTLYDITDAANYSPNQVIWNSDGGSRDNSLIKYISPNLYGFTGSLGYVFKDNNNTDGPFANEDASAKYDVALSYVNGPIVAAASYNHTKARWDTTNPDRRSINNTQVGGSYDFGPVKVAASYHHNDSVQFFFPNDPNHTSPRRGMKGYSLGASVPFGAFSLAVDAVHAKERSSEGFGDESRRKGTDGVVEAKYALSRRTFVYGIYYHADKDGPTFEEQFHGNQNNWGIGMRHNF